MYLRGHFLTFDSKDFLPCMPILCGCDCCSHSVREDSHRWWEGAAPPAKTNKCDRAFVGSYHQLLLNIYDYELRKHLIGDSSRFKRGVNKFSLSIYDWQPYSNSTLLEKWSFFLSSSLLPAWAKAFKELSTNPCHFSFSLGVAESKLFSLLV